jgi:hypothetical protein
MKKSLTGLSVGYELVRVADGMLVHAVPPFLWPISSQSRFLGKIVAAYWVERGSVCYRLFSIVPDN